LLSITVADSGSSRSGTSPKPLISAGGASVAGFTVTAGSAVVSCAWAKAP